MMYVINDDEIIHNNPLVRVAYSLGYEILIY